MLKQMKGVRNMPTSQANVNNASEGKKDDNDKMFDSLFYVSVLNNHHNFLFEFNLISCRSNACSKQLFSIS